MCIRDRSFTHRQAKWIFECCARQPFTEVGALLDVNAKTVERLYYQHVHAELDLPARYAAVRRLGIDEISHRTVSYTHLDVYKRQTLGTWLSQHIRS